MQLFVEWDGSMYNFGYQEIRENATICCKTRFPIFASEDFLHFETGLGLMRKKKKIQIDNNV